MVPCSLLLLVLKALLDELPLSCLHLGRIGRSVLEWTPSFRRVVYGMTAVQKITAGVAPTPLQWYVVCIL